MSADPAHIRPEIKREVDSFHALRGDLRRLESDLRAVFRERMNEQELTIAERRMVEEALERRD